MNALALERFAELADAYGGDLQRWPAEQRAAAAQLLAGSEQARAILRAASELDDALGGPSPESALQAVRARILQSRPAAKTTTAQTTGRSRPARSVWETLWIELGGMRWLGPALAAGLTLGLGVNQWVDSDYAGEVDFLSVALLENDDEELLP
jgi:hypothetical protein